MKRIGNFIFETVQVVIFAVSIFLFIYLLVAQPHKIKGESMMPNFSDGEFLLTNKLSYRLGEPHRGDVVVFEPPGESQDFIKRVIGLPGEEVMVKGGGVYINGQELFEEYLEPGEMTRSGRFAQEGVPLNIPTDSYFVLGDNRNNSLDSRAFGFAGISKITGKAWIVYWPISIAGKIVDPNYSR